MKHLFTIIILVPLLFTTVLAKQRKTPRIVHLKIPSKGYVVSVRCVLLKENAGLVLLRCIDRKGKMQGTAQKVK